MPTRLPSGIPAAPSTSRPVSPAPAAPARPPAQEAPVQRPRGWLSENLPRIPDYNAPGPRPVQPHAPVDAAPATWEPTPAAHNHGNGLKGQALDAMETATDRLAHTALYTPVKSTTPRLTEAQRATVKAMLQPGDVLLVSDDTLPGWRVFEGVVGQSPRWNHAAIYAGDGVIIESGGLIRENVHRVSVDDFLNTHHVAVVRPRYATPEAAGQAIGYAADRLGKPYDGRMNSSDDAYYCSELVAKSLRAGGVAVAATPALGGLAGDSFPPDSLLELPGADVKFKSDDNRFWTALGSNVKAAITP